MFKKIVGLGFSSKGKNAKDVESYIQKLVDSGATEFFTGYNPPYWSDKFGFEVSPNGRFAEHEQITDCETLKKISEEVHKHGFELFINLNAWYYTDETFPLIEKMIEEFESIEIDGIICGNISILEYLKEKNYKGKINISTIMALYNTESIKFFLENYNINKVILSREVTLKEIENLVTSFPETKFEVFGEGDFCRYNNGLCFAEHKYGAKDICTVVVNDLVIKKKFRPDFKKIILDEHFSNEEKYEQLEDEYENIFEKIESILQSLELLSVCHTRAGHEYPEGDSQLGTGEGQKQKFEQELFQTIWKNKDRVDLYFDAKKPVHSEKNKNILVFLRGVKYVNSVNPHLNSREQTSPLTPLLGEERGKQISPPPNLPLSGGGIEQENSPLLLQEKGLGDEVQKKELQQLQTELENSVQTGITYLMQETKKLGGAGKLKADELKNFYAKGDILNLYSYVFFSKFSNIETVKFPTRGRNYNEKLKIIEQVVTDKKVDSKYIDRGISLERTHYDLTYLFGDKKWFREMIENI